MSGGHRFLGRSLGSLATVVAGGRLLHRRDGRRPDPAHEEPLGAVRGEPREVRGPRASRLYTEWFPAGPGGHGTVILTHGLCLTEAAWHYQKRDLAGGPFHVVTWDLPGHGHSDPIAPGELTHDLALDALERVIGEYADDAGVILVGHSLGAVVTLGYSGRRQECCARHVRGTVLVSTPVLHFARSIAGGWPGAGLEARALGRVFTSVVESDLVERFLARDVGRDGHSMSYRVVRVGFGRNASPAHVRYVRDMIASVPPQVRADAFRTMSGYDMRPMLHRVRQPTLVVVGARDRLVNPEESRRLAHRLPEAELLVLPEAGHAPPLEEHEAFNEALARFARKHLARHPEADSA